MHGNVDVGISTGQTLTICLNVVEDQHQVWLWKHVLLSLGLLLESLQEIPILIDLNVLDQGIKPPLHVLVYFSLTTFVQDYFSEVLSDLGVNFFDCLHVGFDYCLEVVKEIIVIQISYGRNDWLMNCFQQIDVHANNILFSELELIISKNRDQGHKDVEHRLRQHTEWWAT